MDVKEIGLGVYAGLETRSPSVQARILTTMKCPTPKCLRYMYELCRLTFLKNNINFGDIGFISYASLLEDFWQVLWPSQLTPVILNTQKSAYLVGIDFRPRAGMSGVRIPRGPRDVQISSRTHWSSYSMGTGLKRAECDVHSPSFSAWLKNKWSYATFIYMSSWRVQGYFILLSWIGV